MQNNDQKRPLHSEIEQKARVITLWMGVAKGVLFSLIGAAWHSTQLRSHLHVFATIILLSVFLEFGWVYWPNIKRHKIMIHEGKSNYYAELDVALERLGLVRMLQQWWFVKVYRQWQKSKS